MVDQEAMFQIENYLQNYTSTWGFDVKILYMLGILAIIVAFHLWWFMPEKGKLK